MFNVYRRMAGQYHYLWTGQYDKKWNTTWCIVDQSQDVCNVLYVIIIIINQQFQATGNSPYCPYIQFLREQRRR